jgi:hypothetical protein
VKTTLALVMADYRRWAKAYVDKGSLNSFPSKLESWQDRFTVHDATFELAASAALLLPPVLSQLACLNGIVVISYPCSPVEMPHCMKCGMTDDRMFSGKHG